MTPDEAAADIHLPDLPCRFKGRQEDKADESGPPPNIIYLSDPLIGILHLDDSTLTVRRGRDLVDLTFRFDTGFDLRLGGVPNVVRRNRFLSPHFEEAGFTVIFPPQVLNEQTIESGSPPVVPAAVAAARSSRLVFRIDAQDSRRQSIIWKDVPITVEGLTEWSELALVTNRRARPVSDTWQQQLDAAGIKPASSLQDLTTGWKNSLVEPSATETSLRLLPRIAFSPQGGTLAWKTPRKVPARNGKTMLWRATLDDTDGSTSMRAIWTPYLDASDADLQDPGKTDPFRLTLGPGHARQLVWLTSMYGVPAYLAETDAKVTRTQADVVRPVATGPDDPYRFIADLETQSAGQKIGVWIPPAFQRSRLELSALGASWNASLAFDPPFQFPPPESNPVNAEGPRYSPLAGALVPEFSLERFDAIT
ncbi:MAG: hypothetical protein EOP83_31595, partial [Verrucomicrobiaceae bacterium]